MKKIELIRHGQARAGTSDYDRLSQHGERQAAIVGDYLAGGVSGREPVSGRANGTIWSGTLKRQQQTASIAHQLSPDDGGLRLHEGLNEYDHTTIHARYHPDQDLHRTTTVNTDLPADMSFDVYASIIENWMDDHTACADASIESWIQFKSRTLAAVLHAAENSHTDRTMLYSSGGVIACIAAQLTNLANDEVAGLIWNMSNASITTLDYHEGQLTLKTLNEINHFEMLDDPELITGI